MKKVEINGVQQLQANDGKYIISTEDKPLDEQILIKTVNLIGSLTEADFREATDKEVEEINASREVEL